MGDSTPRHTRARALEDYHDAQVGFAEKSVRQPPRASGACDNLRLPPQHRRRSANNGHPSVP